MTSTYDEFILLKDSVQQILTQLDLDNKSESFKHELISQITLSIHLKSIKLNEIVKKPINKRNNRSTIMKRVQEIEPHKYVYKYKRVILLPKSLTVDSKLSSTTFIYDHKDDDNRLSTMTQRDAGFKYLT